MCVSLGSPKARQQKLRTAYTICTTIRRLEWDCTFSARTFFQERNCVKLCSCSFCKQLTIPSSILRTYSLTYIMQFCLYSLLLNSYHLHFLLAIPYSTRRTYLSLPLCLRSTKQRMIFIRPRFMLEKLNQFLLLKTNSQLFVP